MKIGLVSTAYIIPTPPDTFGGMERINFWLSEELVKRGHDLTLFGCKGSHLDGATVVELPGGGEVVPREGGDYPPFFDFMRNWIETHDEIDIFHDSTHHHEFHRRMVGIRAVSTVHNPNAPESPNSVFISNFHRNHLGQPNSPFVMNGCPTYEYTPRTEKGNYALFMGALGRHKGFDRVVLFSVDYQIPLVIAGHPMEQEDADTLEKAKTYPWIKYVGIVGGEEKREILANAKCLLTPFRWPEPGCIIAVEAMASAVPIIGSSEGVLPEYIVEGVTGFVGYPQPMDMKEAWDKLDQISPEACYQRYLDHFTIERVADEYEQVYLRAMNGETW